MSDIGIKMGVEGEREFKSALKDINTNLKTLGTEMKVVTSAFDRNDKSAEKLTGQNKVLNKQIDEQKTKLEMLKTRLAESAKEYGENDAKTQRWQQQVNNATAALNKSELQLKNNTAALENAGDESEDAGKKAKQSGDDAEKGGDGWGKFGGVLKGVGAAAGAIAVAAGAAAVALGKEVIDAYADYEQLVGGIDTLFKDSSDEMQKYASNAYKTAGLSSNDYMETVTAFSASLISSLGGDTEAAVEYANMAITDMSDNANKMGTDMSSIQNAYQGFAKQNYTMLDNLKLGYGGTKAEMERLLKDAEKISGFEYNISSYADIVDAIHVVQTEMDITGTTALEAEDTISGAINSTSAAWQNWLTGLGNSKADMTMLTQNLVDGFTTVIKNITPVIQNIVMALPTALDSIFPAMAGLLPTLLETATEMFRQVVDGIMRLLPNLIPVAVEALMTVVDTLVDNLPLIIEGALMLIMALADGLIESLPELIPAVVDAVITIVDTLIDNIDMLIDAAIAIIMAFSDGLIDALPRLIDKVPEIIIKLVGAIAENLPKIIEAGIGIIVALAGALIKAVPQLVKRIPEVITAIVDGFKRYYTRIFGIGKDIVKGIWEGIKAMGTWIKDKVSGFFSGIVDGVKGVLGIKSPSRVFAGIGENMAEGLGVGFSDEMRSVAKQINNSVPTSFSANATIDGAIGRMANVMAGTVNAMGTKSEGQQPLRVEIPLFVNGREFYRASINDFWSVVSSNPRVVSDAI